VFWHFAEIQPYGWTSDTLSDTLKTLCDILSVSLAYCHNLNEDLKADILNLIEREEDEKYKKKYLQIVK